MVSKQKDNGKKHTHTNTGWISIDMETGLAELHLGPVYCKLVNTHTRIPTTDV